MELDYVTVSRLLIVPVAKVYESVRNWFQLIYLNLSWLQYCIRLPYIHDFETSQTVGRWFIFMCFVVRIF